ncbi:hypothetical protein OIV19_06935 [Brucella sp. HL-2]|nr:hypothetical protein [Brucella sp. HL-2]MCV9907349.1 hypothetical protein [Brucella sp. HL-2]
MAKKESLPPLPEKAPGIPANNRYKNQYGVVLVCPDEQTQITLYNALEGLRSTKIKVVVT